MDLHRLCRVIERLDAALAHGPSMRHGDQRILSLFSRDSFEDLILLWSDGESVEVHVLGQIREHSCTDSIGDMKVTFVWRASTCREATVDPELLKLRRLVR